jgi:hypothetical protein
VDLYQFSDWLASTGLSQTIQTTMAAIPTLQTAHIVALSLLFASALMVTLRFFARGLAAEPLHALAARFIHVVWVLIAILALTGALLIIAEPHRTLGNAMFYAKMIMLLLAMVITAWLASVARHQHERVSGVHRAGAALTMLLWIGIIFAGRLIAYYESL